MTIHYREFSPSPALAPYVRCLWTLETGADAEGVVNRVFPDGCMEMVFHLADSFQRIHDSGERETQSSILLVGQISGPVRLAPGRRGSALGVRFHPGGARPFLRFPQHEVAGRIEDLAAILGPGVRSVWNRLGEAGTPEERINLVQRFLLDLAPSTSPPIGALSRRQHRRRFEADVGLPPKLFYRIQRFQRALKQLPRMPIAEAALASGYYDQSHLYTDFRQFAGITPAAWLREEGHVLFLQDETGPDAISFQ